MGGSAGFDWINFPDQSFGRLFCDQTKQTFFTEKMKVNLMNDNKMEMENKLKSPSENLLNPSSNSCFEFHGHVRGGMANRSAFQSVNHRRFVSRIVESIYQVPRACPWVSTDSLN